MGESLVNPFLDNKPEPETPLSPHFQKWHKNFMETYQAQTPFTPFTPSPEQQAMVQNNFNAAFGDGGTTNSDTNTNTLANKVSSTKTENRPKLLPEPTSPKKNPPFESKNLQAEVEDRLDEAIGGVTDDTILGANFYDPDAQDQFLPNPAADSEMTQVVPETPNNMEEYTPLYKQPTT